MPRPPTSDGSGHAEIMAALAQQTQMIQMLMNRVQALEGKGAGSQNPTSQPAYTPQPPQNSASSGIPSDQPCKFGNRCTRPQCWFQHPNSERTESNSTETPRSNAPRSKRPCHNGLSCTRSYCRFEHPAGWDPSGASSSQIETNTWGPPEPQAQPEASTWGPSEPQTQPEASTWGTSEPQTQPEANTWGPSEPHSQPDTNTWGPPEDNGSGWSDGANLSSWADKPNNDWGDPSSVWAPSNSDSTWGTTQSQGQGSSAQSRRGESTNSELGASSSRRGRAASVLSGSTATKSNSSSKGKKQKRERPARRGGKKAEHPATESTATSEDTTSDPATSADTSFEQSMSAEMPPNQSASVDTPFEQPTSADTPDQPTSEDSPSEQSAEMLPNESTFVDTPLDESTPADPPCDESTSAEVLPDQSASVDTPNQPTPADTPDQLTPAATPFQSTSALPSESADQPLMSDEQNDVTSTPEEISDFQDTPALEPSTPPMASSSSESDEPETPSRLVWSDEPVTVVDFADTPSGDYLTSESPTHDSWAQDFAVDEEVDDNLEGAEAQPNLDNTPSAIYGAWDNVQPSAADWGFDTSEFSTPPEAEKKPEKKSGSKSKGKQKAIEKAKSSFNYQPKDIGAPGNVSKPASEAKPKSSVPSTPALPMPTPTPDPPQGVPEEEIPDWLLGADMDAHATFNISRSETPEPSASTGPTRLASSKPTRAPKLSHLSGEDFPTPGQAIPIAHLTAKANAPPKPTVRARPPAWKIIPSSDTSSAGGNRNNKTKGGSGRNGGGKKKAAA